MVNNRHRTEFAGLPVKDFLNGGSIDDPEGHGYRLRIEYDDDVQFEELFAQLLEDPNAERLTTLLLGAWSDEMYDESTALLVESLVAAADRFPRLRALFVVDVPYTENEISWIVQSDLSPIWQAFPRLECLTIRGGMGLSLGTVQHAALRELVIESGGLPREVVQQVAAAKLPELTKLELLLGTGNYGWSGTIADVEAVLAGDFPKLVSLGLRDSEIADQVAELVAGSPILGQLEELDLSMGTLGDEGGRALLASDGIRGLKRLSLAHHYLSTDVVREFEALPIEVDLSDPQDESQYGRYVALGE